MRIYVRPVGYETPFEMIGLGPLQAADDAREQLIRSAHGKLCPGAPPLVGTTSRICLYLDSGVVADVSCMLITFTCRSVGASDEPSPSATAPPASSDCCKPRRTAEVLRIAARAFHVHSFYQMWAQRVLTAGLQGSMR